MPQTIIAIIAVFLIVTILAIILKILKSRLYQKKLLARSLKLIFLHVFIPKETGRAEEEAKHDPKEIIAQASQMFAALSSIAETSSHDLGSKEYLSFEIAATDNIIDFYVTVPQDLQTLVEKQINAIYPDAVLEETEVYNIFKPGSKIAATSLALRKNFVYPIRLYKELGVDSLNSITTALSKLGENEGAAIQILIRPAHPAWAKIASQAIEAIQEGKKGTGELSGAKVAAGFFDFLKELAKSAAGPQKPKERVKSQITPLQEEIIKAIQEKSSHIGFETIIRIVVAGNSEVSAQMHLGNIVASFAPFNSPNSNGFKKIRVEATSLVRDYIFRFFPISGKKMILNTEELATIFHFPNRNIETPNIRWLLSRRTGAPSNTPTSGIHLGFNIYRGTKTPIFIKQKDRQRHMYVVGKSGTGKSTLLEYLAIQDIKNGEGLCFIDPHGDSVENILASIPASRADDVILFDPSDTERPIGMNMMEFDNPEQKTFVVNEMINIFDVLYDLSKTGGPIFEQYMRNAMMLVMEDVESGSTLMEIPRVLADSDFRRYKLERCENPVIKNFWQKEAEKAGGEASLANIVPYITSKLTSFVANDMMRPIIAQQKSAFKLREIMDNKKILILNLSKGKIGDLNSYLLGMVMVGKILMAALSRVDIPQEQRKTFYLYIDEFQNFSTRSICSILSEARKYGLSIIVAHQYIMQLKEEIRDAVFGNAGTIIAFRIGAEDADHLVKEFGGVFSASDFINLEFANAYIKLLIDGTASRGFSLNTWRELEKEEKNYELAEKIKQLSRLKFGRPRAIIEEEIKIRSKY